MHFTLDTDSTLLVSVGIICEGLKSVLFAGFACIIRTWLYAMMYDYVFCQQVLVFASMIIRDPSLSWSSLFWWWVYAEDCIIRDCPQDFCFECNAGNNWLQIHLHILFHRPVDMGNTELPTCSSQMIPSFIIQDNIICACSEHAIVGLWSCKSSRVLWCCSSWSCF